MNFRKLREGKCVQESRFRGSLLFFKNKQKNNRLFEIAAAVFLGAATVPHKDILSLTRASVMTSIFISLGGIFVQGRDCAGEAVMDGPGTGQGWNLHFPRSGEAHLEALVGVNTRDTLFDFSHFSTFFFFFCQKKESLHILG